MPKEACHYEGSDKDASEDHHGYVVSVCSELIEIVRIGECISHAVPPEIPDITYSVDKGGEYRHPCISHLHSNILCIEKTEIEYDEQRNYKMEQESLTAIELKVAVMRGQDTGSNKKCYGYGGSTSQLKIDKSVGELLLLSESQYEVVSRYKTAKEIGLRSKVLDVLGAYRRETLAVSDLPQEEDDDTRYHHQDHRKVDYCR